MVVLPSSAVTVVGVDGDQTSTISVVPPTETITVFGDALEEAGTGDVEEASSTGTGGEVVDEDEEVSSTEEDDDDEVSSTGAEVVVVVVSSG